MKEIIINSDNKDRKLFKFIKSIFGNLKNNEIFIMLRKKEITVNGNKVEPSYVLKENDKLIIDLPNDIINSASNTIKFKGIKIDLDIIYEDNDLIVVNKPSGLLIHPDKNNYKVTLIQKVLAYLYKKGEYSPDSLFHPAACNRLDLNTSGLVIIGKNHQALKNITQKFKTRETEKTYLGIVYGKINKEILVTSIIDNTPNDMNMVSSKNLKIYNNNMPVKSEFIKNNPEYSATLLKPICNNDFCTLLEIDLWTGKKHQIRAHLRDINSPLLGEKKYFTKDSMKYSRNKKVDTYFLHSYKLKIDGYETFIAPPPDKFKMFVKKEFNYCL